MSRTQRGLLLILLGIACSRGESPMKGAVFATAIPVYPGAKLSDIMGGQYQDEVGGPATFTSQSWFFTITDPAPKVVDYYRRNLPQGHRPREAEEGAVAFEWTPPGAAEGEVVHVTVREGQLQIGETVKTKGKRDLTP